MDLRVAVSCCGDSLLHPDAHGALRSYCLTDASGSMWSDCDVPGTARRCRHLNDVGWPILRPIAVPASLRRVTAPAPRRYFQCRWTDLPLGGFSALPVAATKWTAAAGGEGAVPGRPHLPPGTV